MTNSDLRIFCTALAFVTVVTNGQTVKAQDAPDAVLGLAKQIQDFCNLHFAESLPVPSIELVNEAKAFELDQILERHIKELRQHELTSLPKDKETLLKFYDRLQHRKMRRMNCALYETATETKLADLVLRHLDEEIAYAESQS